MFRPRIGKVGSQSGWYQGFAGLPSAIFVIDVGYQKGTVTEAQKLGIPVIGVVDTTTARWAWINHPGNDDSRPGDPPVRTRRGRCGSWKVASSVLNELTEQVAEKAA